ncbi:MAG: FAD-binding protein [Lachnospiraceae bacterium]|nr:FAD-binding protein [Lachnospiraceae bacterium]
MIRINQLALEVSHGPGALKKKAARLLKVPEAAIEQVTIVRQSIDARKKDNLLYSYIVDVKLTDVKKEASVVKKAANNNIKIETEKPYRYPKHGTGELKDRPVIIGAGPAGMFAALSLAENGYAPILLEQGDPVEVRAKKVEEFWKHGDPHLDIRSNVQFGEGGAGTFSDGKLNTLVKDVSGRNKKVLEIFVESGADPAILYDSKPHIGTDVLREVVKNIRMRIIEHGGDVRFRSCVQEILMEGENAYGVRLEDGTIIETEVIILAVGHSARELFAKLHEQKVYMEPKSFAVGLRVQHPQKMMNLSQYGREDAGELGAAPYKVTAKTTSGRGVYSFCMCPGGYVVNASSENGRLAVNGMSYYKRGGENANSAIIVSVTPDDFPVSGPLGGVEFQRQLEEKAFALGGGMIPVQLYGDFEKNQTSKAFGAVSPQICGDYAFANLRELMTEEMNLAFIEGMKEFGRKIKGFDREDAILAGIESRTSSPLRIVRDEHLESNIKGLFPCGEGAGYAGGITSAAMDGLKVAEEVIMRYNAF